MERVRGAQDTPQINPSPVPAIIPLLGSVIRGRTLLARLAPRLLFFVVPDLNLLRPGHIRAQRPGVRCVGMRSHTVSRGTSIVFLIILIIVEST